MVKSKLHVFIGPSGCGKSRVAEELKEQGFSELISHTTRPKRIGEQHGVNYYFVSEEEFLQTDLIEWTLYNKNYYGLSQKEVEDKLQTGADLIAVVDLEGMKNLKSLFKEAVTTYFIQTDPTVLADRMRQRGDDEVSIQERLEHLKQHQEDENYRYVDFIVSNNGTIDETLHSVLAVIRNYHKRLSF